MILPGYVYDTPQFQVWDYVVFGCLLAVSAGIGLFYACTGGKQSTTKEFLLADKQMNPIPVSMSMLASFMSAITLMGNPAEIYSYGTQFFTIFFSYSFVIPIAAHFYIPIFYNLNLTSAYEYLEMRFSKGVRLATSIVFMFQMLFYMAIVLYAPALALNQVTGLNVWVSVLSVGIVCTFYTTLGGMKAVMWTDLIQIIIMFVGMSTILIKGTYDVGGFAEVWRRNQEGGRLEWPDFDPDPRIRHSFWSLGFGATFVWLAIYGVNQAQVQRALSVPTLKKAQLAVYLNLPGLLGLLIVTCGCGLVIFANYHKCDPVSIEVVQSADQLVPLFVMESLGNYPGVPGLFVSAIFSGALSTLSSGFNSLAAIFLQDVVRGYCFKNLSEKQATLAAKLLALIFGALCIGLSYVASFMGGVLQAALALFGIVGGPILGVFTLGIFFPWANWKGAYAGLFTSLAMTLWVGLGGILVYPPDKRAKPVTIEECVRVNTTSNMTWINETTTSNMTWINETTTSNMTWINETTTNSYSTSYWMNTTDQTSIMTSTELPSIADWYALSYLYYSCLAVLTAVIIGLVVSFATGYQRPSEVDPRLITPVISKIFCCCPQSEKKAMWCGVRHDKIDDIIEEATEAAETETKVSYIESSMTKL